ncbi:MAG: dTDP-4-dehydrorhamnose 3,5-epimerase [Bacteroidia bacterium]|nr:MAG: dTDP-4-dehydrorhamnose 3,5-epimerase [Bacteroidia bacterium]
MKVIKTGFEGLVIIEPGVFEDSRGYFFESFNMEQFFGAGVNFSPVQDNESQSSQGVIRGLHYQLNPVAQAKLIRVIKGSIYDVAVDLRAASPTCGKWFGLELNSDSKKQLFIPRGFAHGFSVLSQSAIILYKCDNFYSPEHERGILYNDPGLAIDWRVDPSAEVISNKDMKNPLFAGAEKNF